MSRRKPPRGLSDEEAALWSAYVKSIDPLHPNARVPEKKIAAAQRPEPKHPKAATSAPYRPPVNLPKPATGLDHKTRKKVHRGRMQIDARIDLHGMRQMEAEQALVNFIRASSAAGRGLVLVITGKGKTPDDTAHWWESREKGVLRRMLPQLLRRADIAPLVIGFEPASIGHGGEGAYYVRLRRR